MLCEHLRTLEEAMIAAGMRETHRGQPWSDNCREWVYFDCFIDTQAVRLRSSLAPRAIDPAHRVTHDGQERGLECSACHDGIMGAYERSDEMAVIAG